MRITTAAGKKFKNPQFKIEESKAQTVERESKEKKGEKTIELQPLEKKKQKLFNFIHIDKLII